MVKFKEISEKAKAKYREAKAWVQNTETYQWIEDNPEEAKNVIVAITTGVGLLSLAAKKCNAANSKHSKREIWAPDLNRYLKCKRNVDDFEAEEIRRRRANGESTMQILIDMGLK